VWYLQRAPRLILGNLRLKIFRNEEMFAGKHERSNDGEAAHVHQQITGLGHITHVHVRFIEIKHSIRSEGANSRQGVFQLCNVLRNEIFVSVAVHPRKNNYLVKMFRNIFNRITKVIGHWFRVVTAAHVNAENGITLQP
jgi:hypothetical protein